MQYRRDGNHYYKKLYLDKIPLLDGYTINPDYIFSNDDGEGYIDFKNCQSTDNDKVFLDLMPLINDNNSNDISIDKNKIQKDNNGEFINVLGYGPFNFRARKLILTKLLQLQKDINEEYELELITQEELEAIDRIWDDEEDFTRRTLVDIYSKVYGTTLPWDEYKKPIFDTDTLNKINESCASHNIDTDLINKLLIETNKYKHFTNKSVLDKIISKILNKRHLHKEIVEEIENDNQ